jgi:hypothetical protein
MPSYELDREATAESEHATRMSRHVALMAIDEAGALAHANAYALLTARPRRGHEERGEQSLRASQGHGSEFPGPSYVAVGRGLTNICIDDVLGFRRRTVE